MDTNIKFYSHLHRLPKSAWTDLSLRTFFTFLWNWSPYDGDTKYDRLCMMETSLAEYRSAISPASSTPTAPPPTMITLVALSICIVPFKKVIKWQWKGF